jgi:glycerol-3-phosphate acyltransferase PlsX
MCLLKKALSMIKISVDAMGGDYGPSVIVPAVKLALQKQSDLFIILVGKEDILHTLFKKHELPSDRCSIYPALEEVAMDESPSQALRHKKNSSMRLSINLVKEKQADACVSAGNTGALVATSKFVLNTLSGITRPAIISALPTMTGRPVHMLDLGANVDSTAQQLLEFAVMGSVLTEAVEAIPNPRVGLLNVGQEEIKGNLQVKEAAILLQNTKEINYIGFVEGDDIFKGVVDVVVCDGFVGNVSLKSSEGISKFIAATIKESFGRGIIAKLCALVALPVIKDIKARLDPGAYNGATLVGLQGIVVKSHGSASITGFAHAINEAVAQVKKNVPERIAQKVADIMQRNLPK